MTAPSSSRDDETAREKALDDFRRDDFNAVLRFGNCLRACVNAGLVDDATATKMLDFALVQGVEDRTVPMPLLDARLRAVGVAHYVDREHYGVHNPMPDDLAAAVDELIAANAEMNRLKDQLGKQIPLDDDAILDATFRPARERRRAAEQAIRGGNLTGVVPTATDVESEA